MSETRGHSDFGMISMKGEDNMAKLTNELKTKLLQAKSADEATALLRGDGGVQKLV